MKTWRRRAGLEARQEPGEARAAGGRDAQALLATTKSTA